MTRTDTRKKLFFSGKLIPAVLLLIALLYCMPVFKNWGYWGINDWDQFTFWNAVSYKTITFYRQFPLWNPYGGGGNALLAHPHSMFLSPFFAPVFFLGPVQGAKAMIPLHLFVGLAGMYLLCKTLGLSRVSSLSGSFIFMLSSAFSFHITEGHYSYLSMAFMPWLFLFYIKAKEQVKFAWAAGAVLALMLFSGSVDILAMSILILVLYTLFICPKRKDFRYAKIVSWTFLVFILISAVKLFPLLEFITQNPRLTEETAQPMSLKLLFNVFLSRSQAKNMNTLFIGDTGWHEYGCYVGIMPVLFFLAGFMAKLKEKWIYTAITFTALLIMFGSNSLINLWGLLKKVPFYGSLSCPSRYVIAVLFFFSVLSAAGFNHLQTVLKEYLNPKLVYFIVCAAACFIFIDLFTVNMPIFKKAFVVPPLPAEASQPFKQAFMECKNPLQYSCMYENFLNNTGTIDSYEVLRLKQGAVLAHTSKDYRAEAYLPEGKGRAVMEYFSPNEVKVRVFLKEAGRVILNQNFSRGWRISDEKKVRFAVEPFKGLVSARLPAGKRNLRFIYRPFWFLAGCFVSLFSIVFVFALWILSKKA